MWACMLTIAGSAQEQYASFAQIEDNFGRRGKAVVVSDLRFQRNAELTTTLKYNVILPVPSRELHTGWMSSCTAGGRTRMAVRVRCSKQSRHP